MERGVASAPWQLLCALGQLRGRGEPHGARQREPEPCRAGSLLASPFSNKEGRRFCLLYKRVGNCVRPQSSYGVNFKAPSQRILGTQCVQCGQNAGYLHALLRSPSGDTHFAEGPRTSAIAAKRTRSKPPRSRAVAPAPAAAAAAPIFRRSHPRYRLTNQLLYTLTA